MRNTKKFQSAFYEIQHIKEIFSCNENTDYQIYKENI